MSYSKNGINISYTYDADGLRGSKTINGAKTTYQYVDGTLLYEDRNGTDLYYYYDSYGTITAISAYLPSGASGYVFVGTNSLGDVNALYDGNGNLVVRYEYDAWGKVIAETDANGNALTGTAATWNEINPFRYRGYVYDAETGLYYNNSRYYDAEVGRFISADDESVIITSPNSYIEKNLFAYCDNNPIIRADYGGQFWNVIVGAVIGGAVSLASTAITGGKEVTSVELIVSFTCGAISGCFAATGFGGIVGQMAVCGVTSLFDSGLQNYNEYKSGKKTLR